MTTAKSSVTITGERTFSPSCTKTNLLKIGVVVGSHSDRSGGEVESSVSKPGESVCTTGENEKNIATMNPATKSVDRCSTDSIADGSCTSQVNEDLEGDNEVNEDLEGDNEVNDESRLRSCGRSGFHGFHLLVAAAEQSFSQSTAFDEKAEGGVVEDVVVNAKSVSYDEDDRGQHPDDETEDDSINTTTQTVTNPSPPTLLMERITRYNETEERTKTTKAEALEDQELEKPVVAKKKKVTFHGSSSVGENRKGPKRPSMHGVNNDERSDQNKKRRTKKDTEESSPPPMYLDRDDDELRYRFQVDLNHHEEMRDERRRALMRHENRRERPYYYEGPEGPYFGLRDEYNRRLERHISQEEHEQIMLRDPRYEHDLIRARQLVRRPHPPSLPHSLQLRSSYSTDSGEEPYAHSRAASRMLSPYLAPRDEYPPETSRGRSAYHVPVVPPEMVSSGRDRPSRSFHPESVSYNYRSGPSFWHDARRGPAPFRPSSPAYEARAVAERLEAQEEYERERYIQEHEAAWRRGHPPSPMPSYPPAALVTPVNHEYAHPHRFSHHRDRAAAAIPLPEEMFHPYSRDEHPHHEYRERAAFHRHPDLGLVPINRTFSRSSGRP